MNNLSDIDNFDEEEFLVSQLNMDITNQYVVFTVGKEEYGIPILSVKEIISMPEITHVPEVPDYIPGIINLRGSIIPLYILHKNFSQEIKKIDENSIVIIVQTEFGKTVGFIVDTVSDVVSISPENQISTPDFNGSIDVKFVEKIGHIGNRLIIIISIENLFTKEEKETIESIV